MDEWKIVSGFESYMVSNKGDVVSLKNGKRKELSKRVNAFGYYHVALRKDGKAKEFLVHRLVATHYIANPYNKETVNHIDGDKTNNEYTNLEWADRKEQLNHAYMLGLKKPEAGTKSGRATLTREQVIDMRDRYKPHCRVNGIKALAAEYVVSFSTADKCIRRVSYQDVP